MIKDETGRILVQYATILGAIMDPSYDVVAYRRRLLSKFQPYWTVSEAGFLDRQMRERHHMGKPKPVVP